MKFKKFLLEAGDSPDSVIKRMFKESLRKNSEGLPTIVDKRGYYSKKMPPRKIRLEDFASLSTLTSRSSHFKDEKGIEVMYKSMRLSWNIDFYRHPTTAEDRKKLLALKPTLNELFKKSVKEFLDRLKASGFNLVGIYDNYSPDSEIPTPLEKFNVEKIIGTKLNNTITLCFGDDEQSLTKDEVGIKIWHLFSGDEFYFNDDKYTTTSMSRMYFGRGQQIDNPFFVCTRTFVKDCRTWFDMDASTDFLKGLHDDNDEFSDLEDKRRAMINERTINRNLSKLEELYHKVKPKFDEIAAKSVYNCTMEITTMTEDELEEAIGRLLHMRKSYNIPDFFLKLKVIRVTVGNRK